MTALTVTIVALIAVAIGASMGFSGIGGFLVVPLMMIVADATVQQAVFTALAANLAVTLGNGLSAASQRQIDWRSFRLLSIGSLLGAAAGSWLVNALPESATRYLIAVFLAGLGTATVISGRTNRVTVQRALSMAGTVALGFLAQVSAILVGVGGPAVTVPVLSSTKLSTDRVVGTALLHGACVSSLGLLVAGRAGAEVGWFVVFVVVLIVLTSMIAAAWRKRLLAFVSIRPFVGVMALVGAVVLLFAR